MRTRMRKSKKKKQKSHAVFEETIPEWGKDLEHLKAKIDEVDVIYKNS